MFEWKVCISCQIGLYSIPTWSLFHANLVCVPCWFDHIVLVCIPNWLGPYSKLTRDSNGLTRGQSRIPEQSSVFIPVSGTCHWMEVSRECCVTWWLCWAEHDNIIKGATCWVEDGKLVNEFWKGNTYWGGKNGKMIKLGGNKTRGTSYKCMLSVYGVVSWGMCSQLECQSPDKSWSKSNTFRTSAATSAVLQYLQE